MRIGVLGGTFDPVHNGHLYIAGEVKKRLNLSEVLFVPAGQPCLKQNNYISRAENRVEMVHLALAYKPRFKLSTMEMERAGPTYTVDTIDELKSQRGTGEEFFFILGWDNLAQLPKWKEPRRLVKMCCLVAVPRPGSSCPDLKSLEKAIPGLTASTIVMDIPKMDVSASGVRSRVARGLSIRHLVPEVVDDYVREHGLYATP